MTASSLQQFLDCAARAARQCKDATGADVEIDLVPDRAGGKVVYWVRSYEHVDLVMDWLVAIDRRSVLVLPWTAEKGWGLVVA